MISIYADDIARLENLLGMLYLSDYNVAIENVKGSTAYDSTLISYRSGGATVYTEFPTEAIVHWMVQNERELDVYRITGIPVSKSLYNYLSKHNGMALHCNNSTIFIDLYDYIRSYSYRDMMGVSKREIGKGIQRLQQAKMQIEQAKQNQTLIDALRPIPIPQCGPCKAPMPNYKISTPSPSYFYTQQKECCCTEETYVYGGRGNPVIAKIPKLTYNDVCPECGCEAEISDDCKVCHNCGYSKCGLDFATKIPNIQKTNFSVEYGKIYSIRELPSPDYEPESEEYVLTLQTTTKKMYLKSGVKKQERQYIESLTRRGGYEIYGDEIILYGEAKLDALDLGTKPERSLLDLIIRFFRGNKWSSDMYYKL